MSDFDYGKAIIEMAWEKLKNESPKTYSFLKENNVEATCTFNWTGYDAWIEFECIKFHYGATKDFIKHVKSTEKVK